MQEKLLFTEGKEAEQVRVDVPTDTHANSFDPDNPGTPRTNTGLLNTTYFPF